VTKYRRSCITPRMLEMLQDVITRRCTDRGGEPLEFNGEVDHVHALMSLPPSLALSRFVNNVKTTTSRLTRCDFARDLHRVYRKPVFWSRRTASPPVGARRCRGIKQVYAAAGRTGVIRPSPEADFTSTLAAPRVEHCRQFGGTRS
jgi:putative transposase